MDASIPVLIRQKHGQAVSVQRNPICRISLFVLMLAESCASFFVAKEGCVLVDADYSQIELRVLAHVANDSGMIEAFKENDDIHRNTAAQVFHMPREMVTPLMRSRAKAVNFGIIYGIGAFSLAKNIGVTRKEAEEYIKTYLDHFSGVRNYMTNVVEHAKRNRLCGNVIRT